MLDGALEGSEELVCLDTRTVGRHVSLGGDQSAHAEMVVSYVFRQLEAREETAQVVQRSDDLEVLALGVELNRTINRPRRDQKALILTRDNRNLRK